MIRRDDGGRRGSSSGILPVGGREGRPGEEGPRARRRLAASRARLAALLATRRSRRLAGGIAVVVVTALVAGGVLAYRAGHQGTRLTAYFSQTIGVYPGSDVDVLGVKVGTVDAVQPDGGQVRVIMTVDPGVPLPAGARAVVVAPSVVADRYIQLTPAYSGGPRLAAGAVIPASRTAVPMEIDQIYASLDKLAGALGPAGANRQGALSQAIRTGAANLAGNGAYLRSMITQFSGLSKTLGGSAGNVAATLTSLQQFVTMLKHNNGQVGLAERQLAQVSGFLSFDRGQLAAALSNLATALTQVKGFIAGNRAAIKSNVTRLAAITQLLVDERASLAQALDTAPLAVDNFVNAYDGAAHTLVGRGDLNELSMGQAASKLTAAGPGAAGVGAAGPGGGPAGTIAVPLAQLASLPPLPLPAVGGGYGTPQAILAGAH